MEGAAFLPGMIIEDYFVMICGELIFLYFCLRNQFLTKKIKADFVHAGIVLLILILAEITDRYLSEGTEFFYGRFVTSTIGYLLRPVYVFFVLRIAGRNMKRTERILNQIPVLINTVVCFLNFFIHGLIFYFDGNHFGRGNTVFAYIPFIVCGIYVLEIFICGAMLIRKKQKGEALVCLVFCLVCAVAAVSEILGNPHGILDNACMISLYFYYMSLMLNRFNHDQLTKVYLRSRFFYDTEHATRNTYVISMNINGLKWVNERQGYAAGDFLLSRFAEIVFNSLPSSADFYRLNSDEFAILYRTNSENDVKGLLLDILTDCEKENISVATGYEKFENGAGFDRAFTVADERMLEDKRQYYAKKSGGGVQEIKSDG